MSFYELLQKKLLQNLSRYGYPATDEEHAKFNIRFFKDNEVTNTPNYLRSCCKVFRLYTMIRVRFRLSFYLLKLVCLRRPLAALALYWPNNI